MLWFLFLNVRKEQFYILIKSNLKIVKNIPLPEKNSPKTSVKLCMVIKCKVAITSCVAIHCKPLGLLGLLVVVRGLRPRRHQVVLRGKCVLCPRTTKRQPRGQFTA